MYCYIQVYHVRSDRGRVLDDITQVLGNMYLVQGDFALAVQSLERGKGLASSCTGSDLDTISLVSYFW